MVCLPFLFGILSTAAKMLVQKLKQSRHPEREHLTSSTHDNHPVIDTPIGRVGMLICWDLAFPEAFRELIAQGAKIIIIPCFWGLNDCSPAGLALNPKSEQLFLDTMITARAFENTCGAFFFFLSRSLLPSPFHFPLLSSTFLPLNTYADNIKAIIFANAGGPSEAGYCGLSQVTIPFVGPLTRLGTSEEGMSLADLDLNVLEIAEDNYKVRADLAREDWHYTYRHSISVGVDEKGEEKDVGPDE
jgi:predicted amidohydrolase